MAFPDSPLVVTVELAIGTAGAWVDVTGWVYTRSPIRISRGLADEQSNISASTCSLVLNNRDGRFSPRNPVGPYFGIIGRNTRVRVKVDGAVRFYGEVAAWPVHWDLDGTDVWVSVECAGILRRLGQGSSPVVSTMRVGATALNPAAYWPMEDGRSATQATSGVPNGYPMFAHYGAAKFAEFSGFAGSAALPILQGSVLVGQVAPYTTSGGGAVWFLLHIGSAQVDGAPIARIFTQGTGSSANPTTRWDLCYRTASKGSLEVRGYNAANTLVGTETFASPNNSGFEGQPIFIGLEFAGTTNSMLSLYRVPPGGTRVTYGPSVVFPDGAVSSIIGVHFNSDLNLTDVAVGHTIVFSDAPSPDVLKTELAAHAGENAGTRMARLCAAQAPPLQLTFVGDSADTVAMGAQRAGRFLDLINDCADADLGALYEPRTSLGLVYRTRVSLYNQDPTVVTYGQLDRLDPVDDDQALRNDVTVKRTDGGEARATLDAGPVSTLDPPTGAGRYETSVTVNVARDDMLAEQAGWRLRLGTVDEARYPVLHLDLAAEPTLITPVLALDVGDVVKVTGLPAWLPPDPILVLSRGFTETIEPFGHTVEVNCAPASPWNATVVYDGVAVTEETARYSPDSAVTAAAMTTTATSMSSTNTGPRWTTDPADMPFDVKVTGEVMRVTAISTATPQVLTVTRSVNGVVKTHAAGEDIVLAYPAYYAL